MKSYAVCQNCQTVNRFDTTRSATPRCAKCKTDLPVHGGVVELTDSTFQTLVNKSPLPVVIDFWADWCGPCKAFAPAFAQTAHAMKGQFVFAKLDTQHHQSTAAQLNIRGIPSLIVMQGGKELARTSGAMPAPALQNWLEGISRSS